MFQKIGTVLKIEGIMFMVLAVSMTAPLIIALINKETAAIHAFIAVIAACVIISFIIRKFFYSVHYKLKGRDGFFIVALSWFLASIVGAAPFIISGAIPGFFDAFFESASGFSTTGASILTDVEVLPRSILFWRSFTHWLGGMGIIVFITALIPAFGINGQIVANAETTGPTKSKISAKFSDSSKGVYFVYIIMTVAEVILLMLGGLPIYDALVHTFGTVGTGGLSIYNSSIAHYDNLYVEIVIAIFMFLAAINFNLFYLIKRRGVLQVFKDEETKFYTTVTLAAGFLITIYNFAFDNFSHFGEKLSTAFFQVISILTTTGYATDNYDAWPTFSRMIIFSLFFIGGCSSSTGGGIKCVRVLIGLKIARRSISLKIHPNRITPLTLNGTELGSGTAIKISNFIFTYIFTIFAGTLLISLNGFDFITNLSATASCLGNIGPGFNLVGPAMNYSIFSPFSKFICSMLMIIGRLELYTVLVLFSKNYWNSNRAR
ncbi:MAG: transporter [Clostridiales bacterium]|nr:TrkH family potassium uptake protein [Bacillota bacterium]MEE0516975.1 TrkH family potassium uptake protein [Anaerovoracaceae bacterium]PWL94502.1 MAG: transporter [Clostridiales bacterium]